MNITGGSLKLILNNTLVTIKRILGILTRRDKIKFVTLFFGVLVLGFLEVAGIASVLPFMELLAKPDAITQSSWLSMAYNAFNFESERSFVIASGIFVITLIAASNLLAIITMYFHLKVSWNIAHGMSTRLLITYVRKPYSYFLNHNTSDLRAYLISEVAALTSGVFIPLVEFISRTLICIIIFSLLILVSPQITFTMVAFLGGSYLIIYLSRQKFLRGMGQQRMKANASRFRFMEEMLTGIKTVKIYGVQQFFYNRFENSSRMFSDIQPKVQMTYATPKFILEIVAFGGILGMTMYLFISSGDLTRELPRLTLYAVAGFRLLPALQRAFAAIAKVKHNLPSLDKLYEDLIISNEIDQNTELVEPKLPFNENITIDNVGFQYENTPNKVLSNLDLKINKGCVAAFVGSTGSGKTTLIDIITGLLTPTEGNLRVDGVVVDDTNAQRWQKNIAYVPQEVFLYDDTIRANIALGVLKADVDEMLLAKVMKLVDVHDFVNDLKNGLDTEIGERGVRLSGGQRQRLGLARALYTNPDLLVLDEATSALDSITEKGIIESLQLLPDELTIIIIAHRISTVRFADKIFVLEHGNVISSGDYKELFEKNTKFKEMVELS